MSRPSRIRERFVLVFYCSGWFGNRLWPTSTTPPDRPRTAAQSPQQCPVDLVQAAFVYPEQFEVRPGLPPGSPAHVRGPSAKSRTPALGAGGWRSGAFPGPDGRSRPLRLVRSGRREFRLLDHDDQVGGLVVVEAGHQSEPVSKGPGDQTGTSGGSHQGEPGDVHADGAGRRPLPSTMSSWKSSMAGRGPLRRLGTAGGSRR